MKLSSISSNAISQAMRHQMLRMQSELVKAEKELSSGKVADTGLTLGVRTGLTVSLARDVDRLNGLVDSNGLIASRLDATQEGLTQLGNVSQDFLAAITANSSSGTDPQILRAEAETALETMTGILNSGLNGEHLFAGINTDVKPLDEYGPGSPAKAAFDAAFLGHFGFTQTDPAASGITAADIETFIDTVVEPQFLGAGWQADWSSATDETITSRISNTETAQTSVSANTGGVRKLAMASVLVSELLQGALSGPATQAVVGKAFDIVGSAISDLTGVQAEVGITQNRVENASERTSMQIDVLQRNIQDMEGVDPYEVSTRISSLMAQIETSYALTARIQQLSLVRFLS